MSNLFAELKRRNVFRVGIAYAVLAWLLLQVADIFLNNITAPEWLFKVIVMFLALGFPLAIFFAWAFELTPEGVKRESEVDRSQSITRQTGRKLDFAIIAILALAVAYFAWDKFAASPQEAAPVTESVAEEAAGPASGDEAELDRSIAVLPFVNMSDDESNEYFSDGISEEILNSLASVRELKVAGRTSSFAFKNRNEDLRVIGDALGVEHILEGSVRKAGSRVRITAQLVQVEDGFHLWSETFDRELTDVFAIQDEIANAILEQLKAQLLGGELITAHTTPTDPVAYDKYLIARQRIYERERVSIAAAHELLKEAIQIDPTFAPAHAQLGITYVMLGENVYGELPREEALEKSKPHFDTALELDPDLAEGWAGLGLFYMQENTDREKTIATLEKALALNPNLIDASNWLQAAYGEEDYDKSLKILEEIVSRDPLYRPGVINLVDRYNDLGMQEKSMTLIERTEPFLPNEPWLMNLRAATQLRMGLDAEGFRTASKVMELAPDEFLSNVTYGDALFKTFQWDPIPDLKVPFLRFYGLLLLDRQEEALIQAQELAAEGRVFQLLDFYAIHGRHEDLLRFVQQRWPDLDAYEETNPYEEDGYGDMVNIAFAYLKTGNEAGFHDAMARIRRAHDESYRQGVVSEWLDIEEASYYAMAGDIPKAIDYVDRAVANGYVGDVRIVSLEPQLEPLEGDPRYEAIQDRMLAKVNSERAKLGLDPVGT